MPREIKFRGKRKDIDWKYGYLTCIENRTLTGWEQKPAIRPFDELFITYGVEPESVGEYTGLKDKNGVDIFEGDLVTRYGEGKYKIYWDEFTACWQMDGRTGRTCGDMSLACEVIGNIYESNQGG